MRCLYLIMFALSVSATVYIPDLDTAIREAVIVIQLIIPSVQDTQSFRIPTPEISQVTNCAGTIFAGAALLRKHSRDRKYNILFNYINYFKMYVRNNTASQEICAGRKKNVTHFLEALKVFVQNVQTVK